MPDPFTKLLPDRVIDPHAGDKDRAADILAELHAVLKKHGCVLASYDRPMVLAKTQGAFDHQARVLAEVRQITPDLIEWREIQWQPPKEGKPQ